MGPVRGGRAAVRSKVEARKRRKKKAKVPTPAARASTVSDSDDSDDDAPKAKKKKKAKVDAGDLRAGAGGAAQKLQHLPPRLWAPHELQPAAVRVLVPASELGDEGSAAVAALAGALEPEGAHAAANVGHAHAEPPAQRGAMPAAD